MWLRPPIPLKNHKITFPPIDKRVIAHYNRDI